MFFVQLFGVQFTPPSLQGLKFQPMLTIREIAHGLKIELMQTVMEKVRQGNISLMS